MSHVQNNRSNWFASTDKLELENYAYVSINDGISYVNPTNFLKKVWVFHIYTAISTAFSELIITYIYFLYYLMTDFCDLK